MNTPKAIYKYDITEADVIEANIIKVLDVQWQKNKAALWAVVDIYEPSEIGYTFKPTQNKYRVIWVPTGAPFSFSGTEIYCGTLQDDDGYVWHIFLRKIGNAVDETVKSVKEVLKEFLIGDDLSFLETPN